MTTEAQQKRGSGPLPTERVTGRLRPASPIESSAGDSATQTASGLMRRMAPAEFNTAMIHFYRGEVQRSNTWRNRLDTTTNWAVITAGATLSFVFSSPSNPHFVIPINSILVAIFLVMEARRYRYYEIWSSRVRVLETGYFASLLDPENTPTDEAWAQHLAADLITPHFTITEWEAIDRQTFAAQLSMDICAARIELESKSLLASAAGARFQFLYRQSYRWRRSWMDGVRCGCSLQCSHRDLCDWHTTTS